MKKLAIFQLLSLIIYISMSISFLSCTNSKNKTELDKKNISAEIEVPQSDFILERLQSYSDRRQGFYEIIREPIIKEKIISQKSLAYYQSLIDNVDMDMGSCELENGIYIAEGAVKDDGSWPAKAYLTYNPSNREFSIFYLRSDGSEIGLDGQIYKTQGKDCKEITQAFSLVQSKKPVFDVYDLIKPILNQSESIKDLSPDSKSKLTVIILYIQSKGVDLARGLGVFEWEEIDQKLDYIQNLINSSFNGTDLEIYNDMLGKMSGNAKTLLASFNNRNTNSNHNGSPMSNSKSQRTESAIEATEILNQFVHNPIKAQKNYYKGKKLFVEVYIEKITMKRLNGQNVYILTQQPGIYKEIILASEDKSFADLDYPTTVWCNVTFYECDMSDSDMGMYKLYLDDAKLIRWEDK